MDLRIKHIRIDRGRTSQGSFIDPEYVLHIVYEGQFSFQIQDRHFRVEPGDMILIPPHRLHAVISPCSVHMGVIHFYDHANQLDWEGMDPVLSPDDAHAVLIKGLSEQLGSVWESGKKEAPLIADGLLQAIIGYFLLLSPSHFKRGEPGQHKNWRSVQRGVAFIQNRFRDKGLTIRDVSAHSRLSNPYFIALFKEYTNESPHHYLTRTRLEYAKETMLLGKYNISQAAEAAGFRSLPVFSKVFRRYEGVSPREWLGGR